MNQVLINQNGELLEILQNIIKPEKGQFIVTLDGYYDVFNVQGYKKAKWDFDLNKWVGVGDTVTIIQKTTEEQKALDLIKIAMYSDEFLKLIGITPRTE